MGAIPGLRPVSLRPALFLMGLPLHGACSGKLPLLGISNIALSALLVLYPSTTISRSLSVIMFAMVIGVGAFVLPRCSSTATKITS